MSVSFLGFTNDGGQETTIPEHYYRGLYVPPRTIHGWHANVAFSNCTSKALTLRGDLDCCPSDPITGGLMYTNSGGFRFRVEASGAAVSHFLTPRGFLITHVPVSREGMGNHWPIIADVSVFSYRPKWHLHVGNFLRRLGIDVEIGPQVEHQKISEIWNTK